MLRCRPLTRRLTPGQHGDCPQFIPLLDQLSIRRRGKDRPRTRPGAALGDKAYSSAANRAYLRRRGITAVIPVKEDQKHHRRRRGRAGGRPPAFDGGDARQRRWNTTQPAHDGSALNSACAVGPASAPGLRFEGSK